MNRLPDTIRKIRRIKNMTLLELGNKCSTSESYMSLVESGKRTVSLKMLEEISKALEVPLTLIVYAAYDNHAIKKLNENLHNEILICMNNLFLQVI